jgi:Tfp pilus assembly protein PilX
MHVDVCLFQIAVEHQSSSKNTLGVALCFFIALTVLVNLVNVVAILKQMRSRRAEGSQKDNGIAVSKAEMAPSTANSNLTITTI